MNISSLAVSGQCSSGKSTLSQLLAQKFSWNYINVGEEVKRLATERGLPIEKFGLLPEDVLRGIDIINGERIKSEKNISKESEAQIINSLKISQKKTGLLINFGERSLKFKRYVN